MNTRIEIERTQSSAFRIRRLVGLLALTVGLLGLSACAGLEAPTHSAFATRADPAQNTALERHHPTIEAAALDALAEAWAQTDSGNVDQLRAGSIVRIDGEFVWLDPASSKSASQPTARVGLTPEHVATYIVHPRSNSPEATRANEQITKHEKRLVDRVDPLHRPLYVLTPSGRLLTYSHGESVVEVASMRDREQWRAAVRSERLLRVAGNR